MQQGTPFTSNPYYNNTLSLPDSTHELIELFETVTLPLQRICALAKIKQQILTALQQQPPRTPSPSISQSVQQLFSNALLRFLRKNRAHTEQNKAESNLFFHVMSLAIKYFYSEEGFKLLLGNVTDLIDRHSYRVLPALQFFTEIISTIQCSFSEEASRTQRCRFQRHLTNQHINSMLTLANFCLERGVLPENASLQDGHSEEHFKMVAPEDTLTAAVRLVRACLCFDWQGEKYNELEQVAQMSCLVIPTKRTRQTAETEFEKWLRSSEWIWVYQFLFKTGQSVPLRVEVAGLVGDLARVHMKFFKNKANYRTHLENIVYCFSKMIDELQIYRNSQETIQVALALLFNLNKILSGSVNAMFFEINPNFWRGLLEILKKFIVYQIIGEQIFNANLIYFSFTFLGAVLRRSRFESNPGNFEAVEEVLRDVCRSYEQYLRILLNKIRKAPIRVSEASYYRLDYAQLRDSFNCYGWRQLQIYFIPFKLMKPRYANTNTIYQFFVYICARVCRAVSLLDMFKLEKWEKEVAYSMLSQSVAKLSERFSFTTYKKIRHNPKPSPQEEELCPLPPISEHYEEQIENEEEYCHMLRLNVFLVMDQLCNLSAQSAMKISSSIVRLVSLGLELCFFADLQEEDSLQLKERMYRQKLEEAFEMFSALLKKAFLREYERALWHLGPNLRKTTPIYIHFSFQDYEFVDLELQTEATQLLTLLDKMHPQGLNNFSPILSQLRLLTLLCLDSQWPSIPEEFLTSTETCLHFLQVMMSQEVLANLIKCRHPRILELLLKMVRMVERVDYKEQNLASILRLLRVLAELRTSEVSEEALNKLFVLMKCLLPFLSQAHLSGQLLEECSLLCSGVLAGSQEADLLQLGYQLQRLLASSKDKEGIELQVICQSLPSRAIEPIKVTPQLITSDRPGHKQGEELNTLNQSMSSLREISELGLAGQESSKEMDSEAEKVLTKSQRKQQLIYSGYHRSKTMSLLSKYIPQESELQFYSSIQLQSEKISAAGNLEDLKQLSEYDSKFPAEPMEIQYHQPQIMTVHHQQQPQEIYSQTEHTKEDNGTARKDNVERDEQTIIEELQEDQVQQRQLKSAVSLPVESAQTGQGVSHIKVMNDQEFIQEMSSDNSPPQAKSPRVKRDVDVNDQLDKQETAWKDPDPETNLQQPSIETQNSQREEQEIASVVKPKKHNINSQSADAQLTPVDLPETRNLLLVSSSSSESRQSPQQ